MKRGNVSHPNTYGRINATDRQFGGAKTELDAPTKITNASSREPFTGVVFRCRRGSLDHLNFKSLGVGA